jgi:hypothetical protein
MLPAIGRKSPSAGLNLEALRASDSKDSNFAFVRKKAAYPAMLRRSLELARLQCDKASEISPRKGKELSKSQTAIRIREAVRDQPSDHCMYALDTCDAMTDWTGVRRYMDCCNEHGIRPKMQVTMTDSTKRVDTNPVSYASYR